MSLKKFSWEDSKEKYPYDTSKNPLPIFYDFYDPSKDFQNVYEPAEDSFLLIDSILNELEFLKSNKFFSDKKINSIELGCGSGLISCCYLFKLKELNCDLEKHYCIDINIDAVNLTKNIIKNYNLDKNVYVLEGDLFNKIENEKFDIIIFNPPYVTTDAEEYEKALKEKNIYASWAGGKRGSETIFKFIDQIGKYIKENSIVFLLLSKENEYENIIERMNNLYKFEFEVLMRKKFKNERLCVFKFYRENNI